MGSQKQSSYFFEKMNETQIVSNLIHKVIFLKLNVEVKGNWKRYPFNSPVCKSLDWENGVVGESKEEDWELKEGMAKEVEGKLKVTVRAKDSKLGTNTGFGSGFWTWSDIFGSEKSILRLMKKMTSNSHVVMLSHLFNHRNHPSP